MLTFIIGAMIGAIIGVGIMACIVAGKESTRSMYICKQCGNKKYFIEQNCIETEVTLNADTGEQTGSHDTFSGCVEVVCGVCNATSHNGDILNRNTKEPIQGV